MQKLAHSLYSCTKFVRHQTPVGRRGGVCFYSRVFKN